MIAGRYTYRGLEPHKLTPMPGVHKKIQATGKGRGGADAESLPARA